MGVIWLLAVWQSQWVTGSGFPQASVNEWKCPSFMEVVVHNKHAGTDDLLDGGECGTFRSPGSISTKSKEAGSLQRRPIAYKVAVDYEEC